MDIRQDIKKVVLFLYILTSSFVLPQNSLAQDSNYLLYEPDSTCVLEDINTKIRDYGFYSNPSYSNNSFERDTTVLYNKSDNQFLFIHYCPESKKIFNYNIEWKLSSTYEDDITRILKIGDFSNIDQCKKYFLFIKDSLIRRYGNPSYIHYRKTGETGEDILKLDTLNYEHLFSRNALFIIYWTCFPKTIFLKFDDTGIIRSITYDYYNHKIASIKNKEIEDYQSEANIRSFINRLIIVILSLVVLFLAIFLYNKYEADKKEKEEKEHQEQLRLLEIEEKKRLEKERQILLQKRKKEEEHNNYLTSLEAKYGICDKVINLGINRPDSYRDIRVYSQTKHVVIMQKEFSFSDILDCIVNDNYIETETVHTYRGNSVATTQTDTGSMVGRAIVGGVLLGGAGAVIGGSTAKRSTIIENGNDTSIHNKEIEHKYNIVITVKDISNPVININAGNNTELKDEILSLMKVIISMK